MTDVTTGDFSFDFRTGATRSSNGAGFRQPLDPEIAGEGMKVIMSDGEEVNWTPPPAQASFPDYSKIKALRGYFGRTGHLAWPAWLYHRDGRTMLVRSAEEASQFGVRRRESTADERARYGAGPFIWDWEDSEWRPQPWSKPRFDPDNPGTGKNVVAKPPNPQIAQDRLIRDLIPTVTAAVASALQNGAGGAPGRPTHVDPSQWDEFLQFLAFKKTMALDPAALSMPVPYAAAESQATMDTAIDERAAWETRAREAGIKVDGRWSLDKLRKHVQAELARREEHSIADPAPVAETDLAQGD